MTYYRILPYDPPVPIINIIHILIWLPSTDLIDIVYFLVVFWSTLYTNEYIIMLNNIV